MTILFKSLLILCCYLSVDAQRKIFGGDKADHGEFPYMALVCIKDGVEYIAICGGTILNRYWVLTAAHCFLEELTPKIKTGKLVVKVGSQYLNINRGNWHYVNMIKYPPQFSSDLLPKHDIALLNMIKPFEWGATTKPLKLPKRIRGGPTSGTKAVVSGWGLVNTKAPASYLKKLTLTIITEGVCLLSWENNGCNRICAKASSHSGTCNGDSGGPLVRAQEIIGVLSYGTEDCSIGDAEVYTRVQDYLSWIITTIRHSKAALTMRKQKKTCGYSRKPNLSMFTPSAVILPD